MAGTAGSKYGIMTKGVPVSEKRKLLMLRLSQEKEKPQADAQAGLSACRQADTRKWHLMRIIGRVLRRFGSIWLRKDQ
jgi:hypothetical protein